jgi:hypothetical protein
MVFYTARATRFETNISRFNISGLLISGRMFLYDFCLQRVGYIAACCMGVTHFSARLLFFTLLRAQKKTGMKIRVMYNKITRRSSHGAGEKL